MEMLYRCLQPAIGACRSGQTWWWFCPDGICHALQRLEPERVMRVLLHQWSLSLRALASREQEEGVMTKLNSC